MIHELDPIVLAVDLPEHGLKAGDVGTIVLVHGEGEGYELEFISLDGETLAVTTVLSSQIRPVRSRELPHARQVHG